jgi:NitT/TauT family transport system substrate-binding protein
MLTALDESLCIRRILPESKRLVPLVVLITALALSLAVFSCSKGRQGDANTAPNDKSAPNRDSVTIRFPIPLLESGQASFYLAQDKGFYADENLDVKFQMGSKDLNPVKMVTTGSDTFGLLGGPDTLLVARSNDAPLQAIAIIHRNSNFPCLITKKESGITSVQQLSGKQVGFYYGHISTDVLRNLFRRTNTKVTEVDVGFDYTQFIQGKVDAEWAFTVTAGLDLPAKGVELNFISPANYGIITHGYTIFASDETIAKRPDLVRRFLKASLRGVEAAVANPEEATKSLLKRGPQLDMELNLKRQRAYNAVTSDSAEFPSGYMDREMFQMTYDRLTEEKVINKQFDLSEAYSTRFLEEIHGRPFKK